MYFMDYDSVKLTNYVQRFCIISRVRDGVAEFTLLVQLVNNERAEVAEKVINYVGKQFRRYTTSDIYGIANCELEFYLVNRLANEVFIGKEVDYTCVNAEDEKYLTLEILDKINVIIQ